jgi:metal-responsive CopG/Arc/MetJ family transcriptional regulator
MIHSMETIQVVLDSKLLRAANGAAQRAGVNRSVLVREALREHLRRLRTREIEARDRRGYRERPDRVGDVAVWEGAASWPKP